MCSVLHPSVGLPLEMKMDDHKRHGSPTLVEGNSVLLRKNNDTAGELCFGGENTLLSVKIDEDIKSVFTLIQYFPWFAIIIL